MELTIIKKAWEVKDPTVWDHDSQDENWQLVYADDESAAKVQCTEKYHYINIKVRRAPASDKVLYEGQETKRHIIEHRLEEQKRIESRRSKVMQFPETELFYVQNGYVGNSVSWWGINSRGYTTNIANAQKYTRESILKDFIQGRETHVIWPESHIRDHITQHVDSQNLESKYSC